MKTIGLIPARGGSKGIPRKNMSLLCGEPLLGRALRIAKSSNLSDLAVSTDDKEIADLARQYGVNVVNRPKNLSGDQSLSIDVVRHSLNVLASNYDAVMLLQVTSPFREANDIDLCLQLLAGSNADSVISVVEVGQFHPSKMKLISEEKLIDATFIEGSKDGVPRQNLSPFFIPNGAIYLSKIKVIKTGGFKGDHCLPFEMPQNRSINVDTLFDLELAQFICSGKTVCD